MVSTAPVPTPSVPVLRVSVLGPLAVEVDGAVVEVTGSLRRSLLAVLALASSRVVSGSALVDALWPDDPPEAAQQALQTQISRLRRALGPAAGRLERRTPGYRLHLDAGDLDAAEAERLAREVSADLSGQPARAAARAGRALALWRGPALEEFAAVPVLSAAAVRLDDLHRRLEQQSVAARLQLRDRTALDDASRLAAQNPLDEPTVTLWVRALAAEGRTADAMAAAAAFRRRLADETGLDPTPQLADLEQEVASGQAAGALLDRAAVPSVIRPAGPFEGREHDRSELSRLLQTNPVVTVSGPGGVGKTRLVQEVVADLSEAGGSRAVLVALAAVTDARRVPEALATTVGLRTEGPPTITGIATGLAAQDLLLVLDNCEHLAATCRDLVTAIRARAPHVRVLATSRVSLHVPGEHVLRLQPLPVPAGDLPLDRLLRQPSVRMISEFATRRDAGFTIGSDDVDDLIEVIRGLDGLPLALELAAGQLAAMPLRSLRLRLDRALDVLGTERTDDDARQRTLRTTIDWSYQLLAEPERAMLTDIAIFPAGIDLEALEDLAATRDPAADPVVTLTRLVDASLVVHDGRGRYDLLETIRQFVLGQVDAAGDPDVVESRFLAWADRTAAQLAWDLLGPDESAADGRLRAELANLRVARDLARARQDLDLLIRLTLAVVEASTWRNLSELWAWAVELAAEPGVSGHPQEAHVLGAAANASWLLGDLDAARRLALRGLELAGESGAAAYRCWSSLGTVALFRAEFDEAYEGFRRAAAGDPNPGGDLIVAALAAVYAGRHDEVQPLLDQGKALMGDRPVVSHLSFATYVAGEAAAARGDLPAAVAAYTAAITSARSAGVTFVEGIAGVGLASALARSGDVAGAAGQFRRLLRYWVTTGNTTQLWTTIRNVSWLLVDQGRLAVAAELLRSADAAPSAAAMDEATSARSADVISAAARSADTTTARCWVILDAAAAARSADAALAELDRGVHRADVGGLDA